MLNRQESALSGAGHASECSFGWSGVPWTPKPNKTQSETLDVSRFQEAKPFYAQGVEANARWNGDADNAWDGKFARGEPILQRGRTRILYRTVDVLYALEIAAEDSCLGIGNGDSCPDAMPAAKGRGGGGQLIVLSLHGALAHGLEKKKQQLEACPRGITAVRSTAAEPPGGGLTSVRGARSVKQSNYCTILYRTVTATAGSKVILCADPSSGTDNGN
ncbi:hypothetical protein B7463_g9642, partial [Scytalidium lignicola]